MIRIEGRPSDWTLER